MKVLTSTFDETLTVVDTSGAPVSLVPVELETTTVQVVKVFAAASQAFTTLDSAVDVPIPRSDGVGEPTVGFDFAAKWADGDALFVTWAISVVQVDPGFDIVTVTPVLRLTSGDQVLSALAESAVVNQNAPGALSGTFAVNPLASAAMRLEFLWRSQFNNTCAVDPAAAQQTGLQVTAVQYRNLGGG